MEPRRLAALLLGVLGILILDLAFIASSGPDLFYLTPVLPNPQVAYILLQGVNTSLLYLTGAGFLGISMLVLILMDRTSRHVG